MDIVQSNQVVALVTTHTNSHAFFYPGLEIAAGLPADLDSIRGLSRGDGQRHQQRLHQRPRLGARLRDQRRDDRLVLLRHARLRGDARDRRRLLHAARRTATNKAAQAPNYAQLHDADYTGTPGRRRPRTRSPPTAASRSATRSTRRSSTRRSPTGHSVINGTAPPGAKLKITKDFNLYTNPVLQNTTPASTLAAAGDPDAPGVLAWSVPANGRVHVGRQPVGAPGPAVPRRGHGPRPERLPAASPGRSPAPRPTARCWRPTRSRSTRARPPTCRCARRAASAARVPATLALTMGTAGDVRRVHAGRGARLHGVDDRHRDLDRRRRGAVGRRPGATPPASWSTARSRCRRRCRRRPTAAVRDRRRLAAPTAADLLRAGQQRRRRRSSSSRRSAPPTRCAPAPTRRR